MAIRGLSIYLFKEAIHDPSACINFDAVSELETLSRPGLEPWYLADTTWRREISRLGLFLADLVNIDLIGKTKMSYWSIAPHPFRRPMVRINCRNWPLHPSSGYVGRKIRTSGYFSIRWTRRSSEVSTKRPSRLSLYMHVNEASEDSGTAAFGLDVERDLLRAVTGTPNAAEFGNTHGRNGLTEGTY